MVAPTQQLECLLLSCHLPGAPQDGTPPGAPLVVVACSSSKRDEAAEEALAWGQEWCLEHGGAPHIVLEGTQVRVASEGQACLGLPPEDALAPPALA